jgi:hypothetical protein
MKQCPQCDQVYNDGSLSFCLLDGAPLTETDSEATVVMPKPAAPKKSKMMLWVGLIVLVIVVGIGGAAGVLLYFYSGLGESVRGGANTSPAPRPSATQGLKPSPVPTSSAAAEPSPSIDGSNPPLKNDETDEITPIMWTTSGIGFKSEAGQVYEFQCPENGVAGTIWGSDVYTQDSSICTAAVHAGVISLDSGGVVTVEFRPGRSTYGSTERNGVTSNTFGEYPHSFVVR